MSILRNRAERDILPIGGVMKGLNPSLETLVMSLLSRDRKRRPWPGRELVERLNRLSEALGVAAAAPPAAPRARLVAAPSPTPAAAKAGSNAEFEKALACADFAAAERITEALAPALRAELEPRIKQTSGKLANLEREAGALERERDNDGLLRVGRAALQLCPAHQVWILRVKTLEGALAKREEILAELESLRERGEFSQAAEVLQKLAALLPEDLKSVAAIRDFQRLEGRYTAALKSASESRGAALVEALKQALAIAPRAEGLSQRLALAESRLATASFLFRAVMAVLVLGALLVSLGLLWKHRFEASLAAFDQAIAANQLELAERELQNLQNLPFASVKESWINARSERVLLKKLLATIDGLAPAEAFARLEALELRDPDNQVERERIRASVERRIAQEQSYDAIFRLPAQERVKALESYIASHEGAFAQRAKDQLAREVKQRSDLQTEARDAEQRGEGARALKLWQEARVLGVSGADEALERLASEHKAIERLQLQIASARREKRWKDVEAGLLELARAGLNVKEDLGAVRIEIQREEVEAMRREVQNLRAAQQWTDALWKLKQIRQRGGKVQDWEINSLAASALRDQLNNAVARESFDEAIAILEQKLRAEADDFPAGHLQKELQSVKQRKASYEARKKRR